MNNRYLVSSYLANQSLLFSLGVFLALLESMLWSENAFFSGVKSCYDNGLKTKVLCFIYLSELNVVQKGECLTAFSKRTFESHILSHTVKIFTIYVKFTLFHLFHKVFEIIDNIKKHISWGTFKKINWEDEILAGGDITRNKSTI